MATATASVVPRLKERYDEEIRPALIERFGLRSAMEAPRLEKITLNMGVGDAKQDSKLLEQATEQLATIAGQRPSVRRARKSIAGFKIRDGMPVGVAVTLRGARMYEFLDRLCAIALPRVRDFRGLSPRGFDGRGNYSLGVREQIIFPEIDYDSIDQVRGLDISITTTTDDDTQAFLLLRELGVPFAEGGPDEAPLRTDEDERGGPSQPDAIDPSQGPADADAVSVEAAPDEPEQAVPEDGSAGNGAGPDEPAQAS
jgi:large subunit ribosomal protein L5